MSEARKMFGAFAIALALFFFWPAVIGAWQEIAVMRTGVTERENLLEERRKIMENASAEFTKFTTEITAEDSQRFMALIPIKKDTAELVSAVNAIAGTTGMSVNDMTMNAGQSKEGDKLKTISLTLSMTGSYSSLKSFLESLEKYVRLLNVQSIAITVNQDGLKFAVQAEAYFLQ